MDENQEISMWHWVGYLLLMCIPCVNIILLFVFAFGNTNPNLKNWARAQLIMVAILIVLYLVLGMAIFSYNAASSWY